MQVSFRQRATSSRAPLRKDTYKDKASCASLPPCTSMYLYGNICAKANTHTHTHTHTHTTCICTCKCIYTYMYVQIVITSSCNGTCTYVHICAHSYTHTHTHTQICQKILKKSVCTFHLSHSKQNRKKKKARNKKCISERGVDVNNSHEVSVTNSALICVTHELITTS